MDSYIVNIAAKRLHQMNKVDSAWHGITWDDLTEEHRDFYCDMAKDLRRIFAVNTIHKDERIKHLEGKIELLQSQPNSC